jgi:RIO-like serine/threonine protein kinase
MGIPDFLQSFLKSNNFVLKEIVQISKWKKTFVLKVSKEDKDYILKAISDISPARIKSKFTTEVNVYLENSNDYVPNLVFNTDAIIITDYIKGRTLRDYLIEGKSIHEIMENLILGIKTIYNENKREHSESNSFGNAYANISSLAQSGPIQTKDLSILDKVINKTIAFVLRLKLKKALSKLNYKNLKSGFAHGDFHYNNIFVTPNNEIKFIDFENVAYNEYFDFDILYLLVMIEAKLGRTEKSKVNYKEIEGLINDDANFKPIYSLYRTAASVNPRFSREPLKANQKWLLLLKLILFKNAAIANN